MSHNLNEILTTEAQREAKREVHRNKMRKEDSFLAPG